MEKFIVVEIQLGIASPSKLTEWMMKMCGLGAIIGIDESTPKITNALEDQTSEEYRAMSLGMQALDELASDTPSYTPKIVPTLDSASLGASINAIDSSLRVDPAKVNSSLNVNTNMDLIAQSQFAMANAMDKMRADILNALARGEFVKIDVETHADESAIYDSVVTINREKYNQSGINNMTEFA